MIQLDTVTVRTNHDTGIVSAVIYTTDNDHTDGLEGYGFSLAEALHDLADHVESAVFESRELQESREEKHGNTLRQETQSTG